MTIKLEPYAPHPLFSPFYPSTNNGLPKDLLPDCLGHLEVLEQQITIIERKYLRLRTELDAVEARRRALHDERASCSSLTAPIRRIPEELLSDVFLYLLDRPYGVPDRCDIAHLSAVQQVCRKWQQTVLGIQDVHCGLDILYPYESLLKCSENRWKIVESWVNKAPRNGPLSLILRRPWWQRNGGIGDQRDLARILAQPRQWRRMEFATDYDDIGFTCRTMAPIFAAVRAEMGLRGVSPWASITHFTLEGDDSSEEFLMHQIPFDALPRLKVLYITRVKPPMQPLLLSQVEVLSFGQFRGSQADLVTGVLANFPALRKLTLGDLHLRDAQHQNPIHFESSVVELQIWSSPASAVDKLLSGCSFPHLQSLLFRPLEPPSDSGPRHRRRQSTPRPRIRNRLPLKTLIRIISSAQSLTDLTVVEMYYRFPPGNLAQLLAKATTVCRLYVHDIAFFGNWSPKWEYRLRNLVYIELRCSPTDGQLERMLAFFEYRRGSIGDSSPLPEMRLHVRGGWARYLIQNRDWVARFAAVGIVMS